MIKLGPVSQRLRCHNSWNFNTPQNSYFAVYGLKILWEITKVPFENSHKILNPYTAKYAFYWL